MTEGTSERVAGHAWAERPEREVAAGVVFCHCPDCPVKEHPRYVVVGAWRQCSACGVSEGMANVMGWGHCTAAALRATEHTP